MPGGSGKEIGRKFLFGRGLRNIIRARVTTFTACAAQPRRYQPEVTRLPFIAAFILLLAGAHALHASPAEGPRVVILGFDGADPRMTEQYLAEGKLPNLARLIRGGAPPPPVEGDGRGGEPPSRRSVRPVPDGAGAGASGGGGGFPGSSVW